MIRRRQRNIVTHDDTPEIGPHPEVERLSNEAELHVADRGIAQEGQQPHGADRVRSGWDPHPDYSAFSDARLGLEQGTVEERIRWAREDGDELLAIYLEDRMRLLQAERARRNGQSNFTSDYRNPLSEVKFEREVNLGDLQAKAVEKGDNAVTFLPVLGQDKFIVKGWSHLLAAYPKTGKTELLVRLMAEWSDERILYFTEEPTGAWNARMQKLPCGYRHVNLFYGLGVTPPDILGRLQGGDETLVVLDTVRNLLGLRDEKDNSEVARALIPFIAAGRNKGQTLIAVHHDRKGGGDHGEGIAGGHAFLGAVDIAIELKREGQEDSARRILRGWGRVFEIPRLIYELRDDVMVPLGSPSQVSLNELKGRFTNAFEDNWQTTKQAIEAIGEPKPSNDQATKALEELAQQSVAERDPPMAEGKKQGKTYRWRRAQNFTSDSVPYRSEVKLGPETSWEDVDERSD
jgi:AAA domain